MFIRSGTGIKRAGASPKRKGETVRQNGKYVQTGKPISGEFACETDMWRVQGRKGQPCPSWTDGSKETVCICINDGDDQLGCLWRSQKPYGLMMRYEPCSAARPFQLIILAVPCSSSLLRFNRRPPPRSWLRCDEIVVPDPFLGHRGSLWTLPVEVSPLFIVLNSTNSQGRVISTSLTKMLPLFASRCARHPPTDLTHSTV